jgi:hypothetical protein
LVLVLWGMLVKQFYVDEPIDVPRLQPIQNPFRSSAASVPGLPPGTAEEPPSAPGKLIEPFLPPSVDRLAKESGERTAGQPVEQAPIDEERGDEGTHTEAVHVHPSGITSAESDEISPAPIAPRGYEPPSEPVAVRPAPPPPAQPAPGPEASPTRTFRGKTPNGFHLVETRHYLLYTQSEASEKLLKTIETLHSNLMLDLAPFSPWAGEEKVSVYLFDDQKAYRRFTGRPEWSGGASSLSRRAVYVYKSDEFMGILAHELCHIYFDTFFGKKPSPLWLSEGLATLVQSERGFAPPNWLAPNLDRLTDGGGYKLGQLMRVTTTAGADDESVRLWYAQSYSIVRFMIRMQRGPSFLHFCRELRDGVEAHQALLDAYGMPYNRIKALELAWRYDLNTHKLTKLSTELSGLP